MAYNSMAGADHADCFRELVCELSTSDGSSYKSKPLLSIIEVAVEVAHHLPEKVGDFYYQLLVAQKVGAKVNETEFCQKTFVCPASGRDLDQMISAQLASQAENEV